MYRISEVQDIASYPATEVGTGVSVLVIATGVSRSLISGAVDMVRVRNYYGPNEPCRWVPADMVKK